MSNKNIKELFQDSYRSLSEADKLEIKANSLAMEFLALVDSEMAQKKISKKELAKQVGTSASFITQMFRGDRKPSWMMLAKMQEVLNLKFKITTETEWVDHLAAEIMDYHKRWAKSVNYSSSFKESSDTESILALVDDNDYALAG